MPSWCGTAEDDYARTVCADKLIRPVLDDVTDTEEQMRKNKPFHLQVADTLRQRIGAGHYDLTGLPPEMSLTQEFKVSRHTMRSALQKLVADGLIARHAGRGTTVSRRMPGAGQWVIGSLADLVEFTVEESNLIEAKLVPAKDHPEVASQFEVPPKGRLFRIVRRLTPGGLPHAISWLFTSVAIASRLPSDQINAALLINLIEKYGGVRTARVRQVASATLADEETADQLQMKRGDAILVLRRTYTSSDGEILMHTEIKCRPDIYQHKIDFVNDVIANGGNVAASSQQSKTTI